ncbi:MAG: outer membrane lipoprotein-sorting protein [Acidobacteria bacterium]|nr:outer membrane lipoprotein-sorting protein [Acidobacteriota bacterium]
MYLLSSGFRRTLIFVLACCGALLGAEETDADRLVEGAFDYWRGTASIATVEMTIHRPDWERTMTIRAWTRGQDDSIFTLLAPPKDEGNGTLLKDGEMWMYNPKVNRVIKLPPSMMSQAWMGSDFSNNDLSKSNTLLTDYTHEIVGTEEHEGKKVYVIKSMPKPQAPVIWGMQKMKVREDYIMLREEFYDEEMRLVKFMDANTIRPVDGKLFPMVWIMRKADTTGEFTRLDYLELAFVEDLPDRLFTLSSLRNPGR